MSYIKQSLSTDETIQHIFKFHWVVRFACWLFAIMCVIISAVMSIAMGVWALVVAIFGIYVLVSMRFVEQGLTNKRAIYKEGIIGRKTNEIKLTSIETVEVDQGVFGRIFGYGSVKITGRGISDLVFRNVDNPLTVKRNIESIHNPIS